MRDGRRGRQSHFRRPTPTIALRWCPVGARENPDSPSGGVRRLSQPTNIIKQIIMAILRFCETPHAVASVIRSVIILVFKDKLRLASGPKKD